ncbi:MAG: alpha/beta hydrolase family protein [Alphaproteobacteria bacterium]
MSIWTPNESVLDEPYRVLLKRGDFIDSQRDDRAVPYKIYYPEGHDLSKIPVLIWSHGFGGNRDGAAFISRFLAGQGYVIVHITHAGTDSSLWEGKGGHAWDVLQKATISRDDTLNRMYDVPFVLDQLESWVSDNPDVGRFMDFDRIGMSGHSFGAMTTQVMAGMMFPNKENELVSLRDSRISCGIAYSPVPIAHLTDALPKDVYSTIDIPLFHMTGTDDASPLESYGYEHRLIVRDNANHDAQYLQVLDGGDHMVYNGTRGKLARNPKRDEHEDEIKLAALAFWDAHFKDDDDAKSWLEINHM